MWRFALQGHKQDAALFEDSKGQLRFSFPRMGSRVRGWYCITSHAHSHSHQRHTLTNLTKYIARDLVRKLLELEPAKRLTAVAALKHPWLAKKQQPTADSAAVIGEQFSSNLKSLNQRRLFQVRFFSLLLP